MAKRKRVKTRLDTRLNLYAASRYLNSSTEEELGVRIPFEIYAKDPSETNPRLAFETVKVRWEPGLKDGPTSARFAVVDYNGDTRTLAPPAEWNAREESFLRPRTSKHKTVADRNLSAR